MINWDDPNTPTPSIREYQELEKEDPNLFWRIASGHHQNLLEEALDRVDTLEQFIRDLDIETMQPHMDGHHQCKVRANGRDLTPAQWEIVLSTRR